MADGNRAVRHGNRYAGYRLSVPKARLPICIDAVLSANGHGEEMSAIHECRKLPILRNRDEARD